MYILKEKLDIDNKKSFADDIGISPETFSRIYNKKQSCSKTIAYAITKHYNINAEINEYFEYTEKSYAIL